MSRILPLHFAKSHMTQSALKGRCTVGANGARGGSFLENGSSENPIGHFRYFLALRSELTITFVPPGVNLHGFSAVKPRYLSRSCRVFQVVFAVFIYLFFYLARGKVRFSQQQKNPQTKKVFSFVLAMIFL